MCIMHGGCLGRVHIWVCAWMIDPFRTKEDGEISSPGCNPTEGCCAWDRSRGLNLVIESGVVVDTDSIRKPIKHTSTDTKGA